MKAKSSTRSRGRRATQSSRRPVKKMAPGSELALLINDILVPIDFSVHSRNALKYAVPFAEQFDASLHLVYVVEPTIYPADLGFGQVVLPGVEDGQCPEGAWSCPSSSRAARL